MKMYRGSTHPPSEGIPSVSTSIFGYSRLTICSENGCHWIFHRQHLPLFCLKETRNQEERSSLDEATMAEELQDQIETAEEAGDITKLLDIISSCTAHGGEDDWTDLAESSLDAFFRLVKGGAAATTGDDAWGTLFASLEAWKAEEAIVEVAFGCVVALSSKSSAIDNVNVSLLVQLMKDFEDEATIQEQACLAIEGLAKSSEELKQKLKAVPGVKDELVASKERITNERNKSYPGRAAAALGIEL